MPAQQRLARMAALVEPVDNNFVTIVWIEHRPVHNPAAAPITEIILLGDQPHQQDHPGPVKRLSSPHRGVSFHSCTQRWRSRIKHGPKSQHLGYFASDLEAARAYNEAARRIHSSGAQLNEGVETVVDEAAEYTSVVVSKHQIPYDGVTVFHEPAPSSPRALAAALAASRHGVTAPAASPFRMQPRPSPFVAPRQPARHGGLLPGSSGARRSGSPFSLRPKPSALDGNLQPSGVTSNNNNHSHNSHLAVHPPPREPASQVVVKAEPLRFEAVKAEPSAYDEDEALVKAEEHLDPGMMAHLAASPLLRPCKLENSVLPGVKLEAAAGEPSDDAGNLDAYFLQLWFNNNNGSDINYHTPMLSGEAFSGVFDMDDLPQRCEPRKRVHPFAQPHEAKRQCC